MHASYILPQQTELRGQREICLLQLPIRRADRARAHHHDKVVAGLELLLMQPVDFPQLPPDAVAMYSMRQLGVHRDACLLYTSYMIVNEAGASVYSASKLAAEEFPQYDVNLRSAVSIARRLQDPLAELVKIDPKAVSYTHLDVYKRQGEGSGGEGRERI